MAQILGRSELLALVKSFGREYGNEYLFCPLLSSAVAARKTKAIRLILEEALRQGVSATTIDEIILQSHLFLGFPAMIEASRIFAKMRDSQNHDEALPQSYGAVLCRKWNEQGLRKIRRIYGSAFKRLVPYINSVSPQILTWMVNDGYGQVLSRPGAGFRLRELSVVATLTVTSYRNQLLAHIRGSLNIGVEPDLLRRIISNCDCFCSKRKVKTALGLLEKAIIN